MKITNVECLPVQDGRNCVFVVVHTDEGIFGVGEAGLVRRAKAIAACVEDYAQYLVGADPLRIEDHWQRLSRGFFFPHDKIAGSALAAVDIALWDIAGKALGVPVYELLGGPTRDRVRLYWSHCGTTRARHWQMLGVAPLRSLDAVVDLGREVVARGFTALKTNILLPGEPASVYGPGFGGDGPNGHDLNLSPALLRHIVTLIGTFREAVGPDVDIALDLNFNFKTEGFARIARALEPFDLMWLEIDTYEPDALAAIKQATTTPICSGENLYTARGYKPFLDRQAMDVAMVDVPWNGFTASKKIADLAAVYEVNIAPHNYYSHLSTLMSAHLCAAATNVRILEIDIDEVPWKDDLLTEPIEIKDGHLTIPSRPGWGADLNEREVARHPWPA